MPRDTTVSECNICSIHGEVRYLPIYVEGSEGVNVCHACEMTIVNFIRGMKAVSTRTKLALIKRQKGIKS